MTLTELRKRQATERRELREQHISELRDLRDHFMAEIDAARASRNRNAVRAARLRYDAAKEALQGRHARQKADQHERHQQELEAFDT